MDEERLRTERANRGSWKSRVTGLEDMGAMGGYQGEPSQPQRENRQRARTNEDDNDLEYRLALEASKNEADEAAKRKPQGTENDDDLAKALKLSQEEEELRKRERDDQQQANLLFDDTPAQAPQPTGFNQGYQQQAAVDWFGNPVQQQQPQQTGFLNNAYNQPTGMQPQQTGFQNGFGGYGYQQPQQTGFQQQQQPLQQQNTYNPWAQQMNGYGQQQQQQQQQQQPIQEQQTATPGSNNPWAIPAPQSPIGAQPTGSNNPFATHRPPQSTTPKAPTLSSLQEQQTANQFNQRPNPIANFSPSPAQQQQQAPPIQQQNTVQDPYQSRLNALLSSGEGQDTFGNTGDMRLPAQHTAPGTFVNSAGAGSMGRLEAAKTGNNPFFSQGGQQQQPLQGQYTGMPATQFPAQTGQMGGFGTPQQNNNPFGPRPGQQQQGQQQQGGSLIDL